MKNLPNKLSELMVLALADLKKVENDKRYLVDMDNAWHEPRYSNRCVVCFAGAVIAGSFRVSATTYASPSSHMFNYGNRSKLEALDYIRVGDIEGAVRCFGKGFNPLVIKSLVKVCDYQENPSKWRRQMRSIIKKLEKAGL